jgi:hypothetical protein
VFGDRISEGMRNEIAYAEENGIPITYRPGMKQTAVQKPRFQLQMRKGW